MNGVQMDWPDDEALIAGVVEAGNISAYARAIDRKVNTVASRIDARNLRVRVREALAANRQAIKQPKLPPVLGSTVSREEILAQENAELRAALRGERRREVGNERMLVAIERALEQFEAPAPLVVGPRAPLSTGDAHHRALLLLSDAHGGEVVDPAAVAGLNAYDWDIMHARHEEIVRGVLSHMHRMPPLTGLDIGLLGDGCSGANHQEIEVSNQFSMAAQGVKMGFEFGEIVAKLASQALAPNGQGVPVGGLLDVRVFGVPGNHPRLVKLPQAKDPLNNMDYVSMIVAEERTRHLGNVKWTQPDGGAMFWRIAGRLCYVWHGDGVRSSMPGVPWGGIMRRVNEIQRQFPERIDHYLYGHYHTASVVQGGRIIGNGSVKGVDEWVLKQFGGGDRPTQLLLVFDERASRLTDVRYLTPTAGIPERSFAVAA